MLLVSSNLGRLSCVGVDVDLHLIAFHTLTLALALFVLLDQLIFTLALEVDAAIFRHLVLVDAIVTLSIGPVSLNAVHGSILAGGSSALSTIGLAVSSLLVVLSQLISTILFLISRSKISLGLLRRELSGSRSLGIPVKKSVLGPENKVGGRIY